MKKASSSLLTAAAAVSTTSRILPTPIIPGSAQTSQQRRNITFAKKDPDWKPSPTLDSWVQKSPNPISLRQLTFFGRTLTETKICESGAYVKNELLIRIAHRLRELQQLPYVVLTNKHLADVHDLYSRAFYQLHKLPEIRSLEDNRVLCQVIETTLQEHLPVIPKLALGAIEIQSLMEPADIDTLMSSLLRSRISRRVIAEQHLALTKAFEAPSSSKPSQPSSSGFVGEIFLHCNAHDIVERCATRTRELMIETYGADCPMPNVKIEGPKNATFPFILSHLEYIIGEPLRNTFQALIDNAKNKSTKPPTIDVLIVETDQTIAIRISDQGGGINPEEKPYLWSFSQGRSSPSRHQNLATVPTLAATMDEVKVAGVDATIAAPLESEVHNCSSLGSLTSRPPNLRLGIGLPMARTYAEYWAGSMNLQSLDGYGTVVYLNFSKLGNKNEQLTTRAAMDGV